MPKVRTTSMVILIMTAMIMAGCASNNTNKNETIVQTDEPKRAVEGTSIATRLVASEKVLPADFNEASFRREIVPHYEYMATKATDEAQYMKAWSYYGFKQQQPEVNVEQNDAYFIGVHESGTCPYELGEVSVRSEGTALVVMLAGQTGYCTADATPRTYVIELNKQQSKAIREVVIIESETETVVPLVS
ncbi:hypothetical protein [Paenibacillus harenae]|uniref:PrcB C-terminal domain-containing protein n=1 Tax=Paenibacillus harenae TaxID=306543 RepID=A0ABT9TYQ4_PAEHA|nr:hypothetical protein [Paenibacillus harenae]MDQ0112137.1 hypothetical protein [Paenibacillus harenae]